MPHLRDRSKFTGYPSGIFRYGGGGGGTKLFHLQLNLHWLSFDSKLDLRYSYIEMKIMTEKVSWKPGPRTPLTRTDATKIERKCITPSVLSSFSKLPPPSAMNINDFLDVTPTACFSPINPLLLSTTLVGSCRISLARRVNFQSCSMWPSWFPTP